MNEGWDPTQELGLGFEQSHMSNGGANLIIRLSSARRKNDPSRT